MKLSNKDIAVSLGAAFAICTASYGLYRDFNYKGSGSGEQIGTIVFKKKTAERKYNDSPEWEYVKQNVPVYNRDSIRTAEGSSAVIYLKDGSKIDLDENTFIVITVAGEQAVLNFSGGSVSAVKGDKSSGLKVSSGDASVNVVSGEMSVSGKGNKDISINVASGNATLDVGGKTVGIKANQAAVITNNVADVKAQSVILVSPPQGAFLFAFKDKSSVINFEWKADDNKTKIQISKDRSFKDTVASSSAVSSYSASLSSGDYYWRVVASDNNASEIRRFSVQEDDPVFPVSPAQNEVISFVNKAPAVTFRWASSRIASGYEMEVSNDPLFNKKIVSMAAQTSSVSIDTLEDGTFYWRVRPVYSNGGIGEFSGAPVKFAIARARGIDAPVLVFPPDNYERTALASDSKGITFNWRNVQDMKEYVLEISRDDSFSKIEKTENVSENTFALKNLSEGSYFWRVKAGSEGINVSPFSEKRSFKIVKALPLALGSVKEEEDGSFSFSWKDPNEIGRYFLEVANDETFSKLLKKEETKMLSGIIKGLDKGRYSWRVVAVDSSGKEISRSSAGDLDVSDKIDSPVVLEPINNKQINIASVKKITLAWEKIRGASEYDISIFKYGQNADKEVWSNTVKKELFDLTDFSALSGGKFYLQVRAIKKNGQNVVAKSSPAKGYFVILAGPDVLAPRIGTIKVYVQ